MMSLPSIPTVLSLLLLLKSISIVGGQNAQATEVVDLCEQREGHTLNGRYLEKAGDELIVFAEWRGNTAADTHHCRMRFSTASDCSLHIRANTSFHYSPCTNPLAFREYDGWCVPGCSYIHVYDKDYSNQTAQTFTSSSSIVNNYPKNLDVTTTSRFLYVIACANKTSDPDVFFQLKITAQEKVQYFSGNSFDVGRPLRFSSPFFPSEYVLNSEIFRYVFQAPSQTGFVTISFDDWQLSQFSSVQFDKANIKGSISGSSSPPWIVSDGPRLEMVFDTGPNRIPGLFRAFKGFRASYTFRDSNRNQVPYVHTSCGERSLQKVSGEISFNAIGDGENYYDCIWVIKKSPNFERVMIKVVNFTTQADRYRHHSLPSLLEVREGLTSLGRIVVSGVPSRDPSDRQQYMDHDSRVGFYVRLKGHYWRRRDFVLTFTSFSMDMCKDMFWCSNGRCISENLQCNGIDNCGDNSDETFYNCGATLPPESSGSSTSFLSPVIIIPIVVTVFAVVIIVLLVLFLLRCRRLQRQARQHQRRSPRGPPTVSGAVSQHHRRHRRRGEGRGEGGDQYQLDPPPSYEDVLSTTPIGYLNLGFSDAVSRSNGLIQPPSYDEATSPTATQTPPTLIFPGAEPTDESSDSSVPETSRRSLSTSYSSDDTQRAIRPDHQHRHRGAVSSSTSSSDMSNEGEGLRSEAASERQQGVDGGGGGRRRGGRDERGRRDGEGDRRDDERGQTDARYNLAKPDECRIALPGEIAHNKIINPHSNKHKTSGRRQDRENVGPDIISECSASASASLPDPSSQGPGQASVCTVETSPMVSAPSASPSQGQGASCDVGEEGRASSAGPSSAASYQPPAGPSQNSRGGHPSQEHPQPFHHPPQGSSYPRELRDRPSPTRRIPAYIQKAKNASSSSHPLMKQLSRSMNDLYHQPPESRADHQRDTMPSRQFSHSMQNVTEGQPDRRHRDAEQHYPLGGDRRYHHRSQTLPAAQDMLRDSAEWEGRSAFIPVDRQNRRSRSEDSAEHSQARPDPQSSHSHPDSRHREQDRPELTPRERGRLQAAEGSSDPPSTRPKPQPKPRRLQPAQGGRSRPEPRQRQSQGGHRDPQPGRRPNEWSIPPPSGNRRPPPTVEEHRNDYRQRQSTDPNDYRQRQSTDPNDYRQRQSTDPNDYRQRQSTDPNDYRQRQSTDPNGSRSNNFPRHYDRRDQGSDGNRQLERGHPHDNRNTSRQSTPGAPQREGVWQERSRGGGGGGGGGSRPSAPPRPDGAPRPSSRGQEHAQRTHRGRDDRGYRYDPGREEPTEPPPHSTRARPPMHRQGDPPPYRPREPERGGPREPERGGPREPERAGPKEPERGGPREPERAGPREPERAGPRPSQQPPASVTRTPPPTSARPPFPHHRTTQVPPPRSSAQLAEGGGFDLDPSPGNGSGGQGQGCGGAPSPHPAHSSLPPAQGMSSLGDALDSTSSPGTLSDADAPFLSLRLGDQDQEEEEDIFV